MGGERCWRRGKKEGVWGDEIGNIMLLNNDSLANEITIHNIISSLFVNENIMIILPFSNPININF